MTSTKILLYAFPLFFALIVLEYWLYRKDGRPFPKAEAGISLLMALIYQILNPRLQGLLKPMNEFLFELRPWTIPTNVWWSWVLGFFLVEFAYYWLHRFGHEIRWMWASHSVHHSPTSITFSGAYRLAVTGVFSGMFVFFLPLMILGFAPKMIFTIFALNLIFQFFLHTELVPKLGFLEKILNTPSHHRVHHAINDQYIDKNYGGILIIFDRMFGTYAVEDKQVPIAYGLIGKTPTLNPIKLFFQEWMAIFTDLRQARSLKEAFFYAFGRPGWSPKGSSLDKSSALNESGSTLPPAQAIGDRIYATDTRYRR